MSTDSKKYAVNLLDTAFPMRGDRPSANPAGGAVASRPALSGAASAHRRPAQVCAARRSALRQRRHSHRPWVNQDSQRHHHPPKTPAGFDAPYVPGWDCHGLPIEHQIEN